MDFALEQDANGLVKMSWEKSTNIFNLIWFSLNIPVKFQFNNPNFGIDLSDIKKLTDDKIALIQGRYEKALQWIVDIGKANSMNIDVEKDTNITGRVNIRVVMIQADGTPVPYDTFKAVGGPEDGFTI